MVMINALHRLASCSLFVVGAAAVACSAQVVGDSTPVESTVEPIINGNTVSTDTIGTPILSVGCSSTLLSDRWLITAHHCLTNEGVVTGGTPVTASTVTATLLNGTHATGSAVYLHPTLDVALLSLSSSLLNANGHPWANPLYLGQSTGLAGQTLYCQGWGDNTFTSGYGTLRSASIKVSQGESGGYQIVPNSSGQIDWLGDSGSSCFTFIGGYYNITGVQSTCTYSGTKGVAGGSVLSCHQVGIDFVRDWVEGIVGNSATVFVDSNYGGNTEQILPGGPTSSRYDLPMLTVGNDDISSATVPRDWTLTLYQNSGFGGSSLALTSSTTYVGNAFNDQTSSAAVSGGVLGFVDGNFGSGYVTLNHGGAWIFQGGNFDNAMSSLTVPAGWTATFYDNGNLTGTSVTFTEGSYSVIDSAFNDRASSVYVQEPAAVYLDSNYGNSVSRLLPGCYDVNQMGIANDFISSVYAPAGTSVQLFLNSGLSGSNVIYTSSQSSLGSWNDQASGVCVYADPVGCGTIAPGQALLAGQSFESCDGRFTLSMQTDGNLVLYEGATALWATGTQGTSGHVAVMQSDGNFVLYDTNNHALWSSSTSGHPGAYVSVQIDGNLVVYSGTSALWASNTCCH